MELCSSLFFSPLVWFILLVFSVVCREAYNISAADVKVVLMVVDGVGGGGGG